MLFLLLSMLGALSFQDEPDFFPLDRSIQPVLTLPRHSPRAEVTLEEQVAYCLANIEALETDPDPRITVAHVEFADCLDGVEIRLWDLWEDGQGEGQAEHDTALANFEVLLSRALESDDPVVLMPSLMHAGQFRFEGLRSKAERHLGNGDWRVVFTAARALGGIGTSQSVPALQAALERSIPAITYNEIETTLVILDETPPVSDRQRVIMDQMSSRERRRFVRNMRAERRRLLRQIEPEEYSEWWSTRLASLSELQALRFAVPIAGGGAIEYMDPCPSMRFVADDGARFDFAPVLEREMGFQRLSNSRVELAAGTLFVEREDIPHWHTEGPPILYWQPEPRGEPEPRFVVLEREVSVMIHRDDQVLLFAGPFGGPSNGALFEFKIAEDGPQLRKLAELPGAPMGVLEGETDQFAILTISRAAYRINLAQGGEVETLTCEDWR